MGKNIEMLKIYRKVLSGNVDYINKILPNMYAMNFYDVDFNYLKEKKISNIIVDIDGTILPVDDVEVPKILVDTFINLKGQGFNICLVSNNKKERVEPVAKILDVNYLYKANKPLPECYDKTLEVLGTNDLDTVAMIGDQMLTDVYGANSYKIYSVLVRPIGNKNNIGTYINRQLQNRIEDYLKKKDIFDKKVYYKK